MERIPWWEHAPYEEDEEREDWKVWLFGIGLLTIFILIIVFSLCIK